MGTNVQWVQSYVTDDKLYCVYLAPNALVTLYPWKANPKQTQIALRHVRGFLRENRPAAAAQPFAAAAK